MFFEHLRCRRLTLADNKGHQSFLSARRFLHHHGAVTHTGMRAEGGLDFTEFDAVPAQFDLCVLPSEELDLAVGQVSSLVTRQIHTFAPTVPVWIDLDEAICGQFRATPITDGHTHTADRQFPWHAHGHGDTCGVDDVDLHVAQGAADRHLRLTGLYTCDDRTHGTFGRAVRVEEPARTAPALHHLRRTDFAGGDQDLQVREIGVRHAAQRTGRNGRVGDTPITQHSFKWFTRQDFLAFGEHCRAADGECHEHLAQRRVETDRGEVQRLRLGRGLEELHEIAHEVEEPQMCVDGAFWTPCGAGRVDHIRRVVCPWGCRRDKRRLTRKRHVFQERHRGGNRFG